MRPGVRLGLAGGRGGQLVLDGRRRAAFVLNLMENTLALSRMRAASLTLGRPHAAAEIARRLTDLLPGGTAPVGVPAAAGIGGT